MPEGMPVALKSIPYATGGHYRVARRFAPQASQTAGILWSFRNPSATLYAVVSKVRLRLLQIAAPTAAIEDQFSLTVVRGQTTGDTTGGTSIAPAATMQKMRASMGNSGVAFNESTAAGGLTGGNGTADGNFFLSGSVWVPAAVQTTPIQAPTEVFSFQPDLGDGEHPIVLAQNEAFRIRNENALGTASGLILYLNVSW